MFRFGSVVRTPACVAAIVGGFVAFRMCRFGPSLRGLEAERDAVGGVVVSPGRTIAGDDMARITRLSLKSD